MRHSVIAPNTFSPGHIQAGEPLLHDASSCSTTRRFSGSVYRYQSWYAAWSLRVKSARSRTQKCALAARPIRVAG